MNDYIKNLINMARPFILLGEKPAHSGTQRALTLPEKDLDKLCTGMSAEDKAEAKRLRDVYADAGSDFVVFVASRGVIDAD